MVALTTAVITFGMAHPPESNASVDFVFDFTDPPGVGFNAAGQVGADRRASLNMAAGIIEALFTNYNATVNIEVDGSQTDDDTLASVASNFHGPFAAGFRNRGDVGRIILGEADPAPGSPDGMVYWNFEDFSWEPFSDFQSGEMDLITVAAHELLHTVGFFSEIWSDGSDSFGTMPGNSGNWVPFDEFMADSTGAFIDGAFANNGTRWNAASIGGTGTVPATDGLYFNGANASAANGGNPVPLYSPTTWLNGSSGSHLDTDFFVPPNTLMMNHSLSVYGGLNSRVVDDITIGILKDIGYTLVVPEPTSLSLVGVALLCTLLKRRT